MKCHLDFNKEMSDTSFDPCLFFFQPKRLTRCQLQVNERDTSKDLITTTRLRNISTRISYSYQMFTSYLLERNRQYFDPNHPSLY
jgi:hypothetical protein